MTGLVNSTTTIRSAADASWDVVVVGGGPAGAIAAREIARFGASVLLIDKSKFPRYKVCGGCLNQRALSTLKHVGLERLPQQCGAKRTNHFVLAAAKRRAKLRLADGASLSRSALDAAMVAAAIDSGVHFLAATTANLGPPQRHSRLVLLSSSKARGTVQARVVLAADGLGGRLLASGQPADTWISSGSRIGAGAIGAASHSNYKTASIYMACGAGGYVGLVRVENDQLNIAAALAPDFVKRSGGIASAAGHVIREAGLPDLDGLANLPWRGTPHLTRSTPRLARYRTLALGDATGYVEPFTGEGMAWALEAGVAVAPIALDGLRSWTPELVRRWYRDQRRRISGRWICRTLSLVTRHSALTNAAVSVLSHMPGLATPFVSAVNSRCRFD